jgi:anti-sigma factor RsiW
MQCRDCEPLLIDHACAQLDDLDHAEIARHLAGCSACALEYCRLRADLAGIAEAHAEAPHPRVYHRLRRRVAAEVGARWWTHPWRLLLRPIPVYGAVLVSLVPVVLWLVTSMGHRPPAPPTHRNPYSDPDERSYAEVLGDYDAIALPLPHRDVL